MTAARKPLLTGGCQCGQVRFAVYAAPAKVGLCHCRMCQKATAAPFASLAEVAHTDFAWTRGAPSAFRSSSLADRDFCAACGTPLTYREVGGDVISVLTGAFDEPGRVAPTFEVGTESKLDWLAGLAELPGQSTLENSGADALATLKNFQHPDHETEAGWTAPIEPNDKAATPRGSD